MIYDDSLSLLESLICLLFALVCQCSMYCMAHSTFNPFSTISNISVSVNN